MNRILNKIFQLKIILIIFSLTSCIQEGKERYKDASLPIEERVDDLLERMTLEEKFWQLFMIPGDLSDGKEKYKHGIFGFQINAESDSKNETEQILRYSGASNVKEIVEKINKIQKYFIEETRLGIPIIPFDEALHGLVQEGATAFPQAIALAASWDTNLVSEVAKAIALETKSRGIRQVLSPVLNISRDVRWGRTEETYGEDPFLTTQMGLSFIKSFEKLKVIATPKHFIANVGDGGRDSYPIHFNERLMEEIYFPAFKKAVQEAKAGSIMTAYNSINGRPSSANNWLLNEKLKDDWGFDGFVISDAGATGGANVLHFTTKNYAESTEQAIENGLDVIFQTSYDHYPLFYEAFIKGIIDEHKMDEAVRRVLRAKFKLGLFENSYASLNETEIWKNSEKHKLLAEKASLESIVLLKNKKNLLPLDKKIKSITVIGTDAVEARFGGYSGPGNNPVSILDGIKNAIDTSCQINYAPGCSRSANPFVNIAPKMFYHNSAGIKKAGLKGQYFNNTNLEGDPVLTRTDPDINFNWTLYSPDQEKINNDQYSVRWTGKLIAPATGSFEIGISGDDGYRLYIDGELIIDNWKKQTVQTITRSYSFSKDQVYDIKVEFYETTGGAKIKLIWDLGVEKTWEKEIKNAVALANESEITIIVAGIEEGEFRDRAYLNLPGYQEEQINRIAALGKPVVVVLVGGSAIIMENWINQVSSIIDVWYPGEEGGNAIAKVLFGDYNPAGRLPVSFPIHESQLPLYYNHKPTGRGDDYLNLSGKSRFPFGFGLSFSKFQYHDLHIDNTNISLKESTTVRFKLKNIGDYDGDEVVQLYIRDLYASVARPVMELKGFKRVHLKKGETKEISFNLNPELFTMLDEQMNLVVEPGEFSIMIGASSRDIRLRGILNIKN